MGAKSRCGSNRIGIVKVAQSRKYGRENLGIFLLVQHLEKCCQALSWNGTLKIGELTKNVGP